MPNQQCQECGKERCGICDGGPVGENKHDRCGMSLGKVQSKCHGHPSTQQEREEIQHHNGWHIVGDSFLTPCNCKVKPAPKMREREGWEEWELAFIKKHWDAMFECGDYDTLLEDLHELHRSARLEGAARIVKAIDVAENELKDEKEYFGGRFVGNKARSAYSELEGRKGV